MTLSPSFVHITGLESLPAAKNHGINENITVGLFLLTYDGLNKRFKRII